MSTVSYILPLKAPSPLPATGVDIVTFKVWKNTLIAHLQQDAHHHHFLPGGHYANWRAAEFGERIQQLNDNDQDKITADGKQAQLGVAGHRAELQRILTSRNAQLAKFITHIATLCHHTENDDVTNNSTSVEWILDYLKKHYGLMTKGANFLNIAEHTYKHGTPYQTFYKQYRAAFVDNLRKQNDVVQYKNNLVLTEDEKLTPSFENAIVMWTLEKIDPRLPARVKKNYGYQMTGQTTLKDIQAVVFENIDLMIEELDQAQSSKAFASHTFDGGNTAELNAIKFKPTNRGARSYSFRGRNAGGNRQSKAPNVKRPLNNNVAEKFCRICNLAGSDARVYTSHEIGNCSRLTLRDLESFRTALSLNVMTTVEDNEPMDPPYALHPDWDEEELLSHQQNNEED